MPLRWIFWIVFWAVGVLDLTAQKHVVSGVTFSGTSKIKTSFLAKNIELGIGDTLSLKKIERDLLSLTSLPPVVNTTYRLDTVSEGQIAIEYILVDALTFFPGISLGNRGDGLWLGAGIQSLNLFQTGQQISVNYVWVDQQHNIDLFYRAPFIGQSRWSVGGTIKRNASLEPLFFEQGTFDYNYSIKTLGVSPAFRFTPRHSLELPIGVFEETYAIRPHLEQATPMGIPTIDTKRKSLIELIYRSEKIKYDYFLLDGIKNRFFVQWVNTFGEKGNFYSITNITQKFIQLGRGTNIAMRLKLSLATNGESPFAPFVLDNDANIRGVGSRVQRGTGEILTNLEVRQTLFCWDRFAAQAVGFSDLGSWRTPGGSLNDFRDPTLIKLHTGAGLRLIYTRGHNYILRIDYGFDALHGPSESSGFVIGIGQYF